MVGSHRDRSEPALLRGHRGLVASPHFRRIFACRNSGHDEHDEPSILEHEPDQQQCADQLGEAPHWQETTFDTRLAAKLRCSELETGRFTDSFRVMELLP